VEAPSFVAVYISEKRKKNKELIIAPLENMYKSNCSNCILLNST
jgi:hypothetical protein